MRMREVSYKSEINKLNEQRQRYEEEILELRSGGAQFERDRKEWGKAQLSDLAKLGAQSAEIKAQ